MKINVVDFINSNKNWEELLINAPYYVSVSHDDPYVLLKYSMLESDFSNEMVRECRGIILKKVSTCGKETYILVCVPFFKFGNYGESYVPDIDWDSVEVEEKIDGSLIKVWWDDNTWHISTNNTIDAGDASVGVSNKTFLDLFHEALKDKQSAFFDLLDKNNTYMFELVSPYNKVVVPYSKTELYLIGVRNKDNNEVDPKEYYNRLREAGVKMPKRYKLKTLDECIEFANSQDWKHEGFVVVDKNWNRVKVKGSDYLHAAKIRKDGPVSEKNVVSLILNENLDDFLGYYPEFSEFVQSVREKLDSLVYLMESCWKRVNSKNFNDKKEFALMVNTQHPVVRPFLFLKWSNQELTAVDFIKNNKPAKIVEMFERMRSEW